MNHKTPQERLEIREFVLDANLYLIANSIYMLCYLIGFIYFLICVSFYKGIIELPLLMTASVSFLLAIMFAIAGHRSILKQKKYISRLDSVFEE